MTDDIIRALTQSPETASSEAPASTGAPAAPATGGRAQAAGTGPAERTEQVRQLLSGAVDIHVHSAPDAFAPRRAGAAELAEYAARLGMGGVVIKDHHGSTVGLAASADRVYSGVRILGGVTLNDPVGGLNPDAVDVAARAGGKMVWLPTKSARAHRAHFGNDGGISILDADGALVPEMQAILEIAKAHDLVIGTGHISVAESFALVEAAVKMGAPPPVVTHANTMIMLTGMTGEQMGQLARLGAFVELSLYPIMPTHAYHQPEQLPPLIENIGADRAILSTDFGQLHLPIAPEGMWMGVGLLLKLGVPGEVVRKVVHDNPRRLVGI